MNRSLQTRNKGYCDHSARQIIMIIRNDSDMEEDDLSSHDLHSKYVAALAKIGAINAPRAAKKCTPIFQRDTRGAHKQAVKDAAAALSTLWNSRIGK
jgi:hypothetical protein